MQYVNSVNASLQYANSAIATFPLCPNSNMIVFLLLQNRGAIGAAVRYLYIVDQDTIDYVSTVDEFR